MAAEKRRRAGNPRSRAGCRTCRIRRVKCDESRPNCTKCTSTGRACEWFAKENEGPQKRSNVHSHAPASPPPRANVIAPLPGAKILELRGFEYFSSHTARGLTHFFDSDFWQAVALQLCHSEPCILNAVIALGTLHEIEESKSLSIARDRMHDSRHRFAIGQYNTAINGLNVRLQRGGKDSHKVLLTACIIFIYIELHRGRFDSAISHLRSGIDISYGLSPDTAMIYEGRNDSVEDALSNTLWQLDMQRYNFEYGSLLLPHSIDALLLHFGPKVPSFRNIVEARRRCHLLVATCFQFFEAYNAMKVAGEFTRDSDALQHQTLLLGLLTLHHDALVALQKSIPAPKRREEQSILVLRVHVLTARTWATISLEDDDFDSLLNTYQQVISLAQEFMQSLDGTTKSGSGSWPTFTADWGFLPCLTLIAIKCRDPAVRNRALALIVAWPHREGFWNAALAIKFVEAGIKIQNSNPDALSKITWPHHPVIMNTSSVETSEDQTTMPLPESSSLPLR